MIAQHFVVAVVVYEECGGEGGIRTHDTFPYTHFPGVLLQPLGHLTALTTLHVGNTGFRHQPLEHITIWSANHSKQLVLSLARVTLP